MRIVIYFKLPATLHHLSKQHFKHCCFKKNHSHQGLQVSLVATMLFKSLILSYSSSSSSSSSMSDGSEVKDERKCCISVRELVSE